MKQWRNAVAAAAEVVVAADGCKVMVVAAAVAETAAL